MDREKLKVLWLAVTPSLYATTKIGGWIASLEENTHNYLADTVELAIAFETDKQKEFKVKKNGTTYYPVSRCNGIIQKIMTHNDAAKKWAIQKEKYLSVIRDYNPDIIHCFGSEWPYAAIVKDIAIPLVIHMQGFLNIYNMSQDLVISNIEKIRASVLKPKQLLRIISSKRHNCSYDLFERDLMKSNHYFMGRTEWDKNIVKYYSPGAHYYHVPEAIRPDIYDAPKTWKYNRKKKIQLITITQAGYLKGNEIILRTAQILKNLLGVDFEWRVAGRKDTFPLFEKKSGIKATDVNITLLGMIDPIQIVDELTEAVFYIHPAIIDNSPNSLCEAQLIGCPVIAANVGGVPQLVEDGKTGFLYPYNEPHTLAFKICNLKDDEELLTTISNEEIRVSRKRHDPKTVADTVYRTYVEILSDYKEKHV